MLDPRQYYSGDRTHDRAVDALCPYLAAATKSGTPSVAPGFPTGLTQAQVIEVAVRIARSHNTAVLAGPGHGLTFVPLRGFVRPMRTPARPARKRVGLYSAPLSEVSI